jgi:AcrR family transcriptional regulator
VSAHVHEVGAREVEGHPPPGDDREQVRRRIVDAATDLLEREGHDAITIRAVATAAGVQLPAIYRLFGSKDGLLEEVSERSLATFLADREVDPEPHDPLDDLRAGWDLAVEFGLANPALYTLMFTEPTRATSAALQAGTEMVLSRLRRLAVHGLLGVDEVLAAAIVQSTARGAVLTWLSLPEDRRDPAMLAALRESTVAAVTGIRPIVREPSPAGAARALRASLSDQDVLSEGERRLLAEWLDRIAAAG